MMGSYDLFKEPSARVGDGNRVKPMLRDQSHRDLRKLCYNGTFKLKATYNANVKDIAPSTRDTGY